MKYIILNLISCFIFLVPLLQGQSNFDKIKIKNDSLIYYKSVTDKIQSEIQNLKLNQIQSEIQSIGLPKLDSADQLINHKAMSLVYSEKHEQPKWVSHIITSDIRHGSEGRSNDFRPDPLVTTGTAVETDYFLKTFESDGTPKYDGFG